MGCPGIRNSTHELLLLAIIVNLNSWASIRLFDNRKGPTDVFIYLLYGKEGVTKTYQCAASS